ncbi:MAG: fibronectin type III domain-containing protein [Vicingaceae bacterium]
MRKANHLFDQVRSVLQGNKLRSIFFSLLTLIGFASAAQCTYQLELQDTFGDGWNGGAIDVKVATTTTTYTLGNGTDSTINLVVNTGDSIVLNYLGGSGFPFEVSFELLDPSGNSIYNSGTGPAVGRAYADTAFCASCIDPSALSASNISTTSADLSWTEQNAATSWHLEVTTLGSGLGTGVRAVVNSNPYTATGLTPGTDYEYYVRSICTPGSDSSGWVGPFSFSSSCNAISTFPYFEGFETAVPPACWGDNVISGSRTWNSATSNQSGNISPYAGSNMAYFYSGNYNGDAAQLISPNFDLTSLANPQLNFWHTQEVWGSDQDTLGVYYRTSSSGTWTYLTSFTSSITSWSQVLINLPNPSADYAIMLEAYSGYGYGVTVDNFEVRETPACSDPTALTASNVTANSADLGWTENGTATIWDVEWGSSGFTQGAGTLISGTTTNPQSISGLNAGVSYDFYVRADCGGSGTSSWVGPFTFTTPPAVATGVNCTTTGATASVIFTEEFDNNNAGWTGDVNSGNGSWEIPDGATSTNTGADVAHSGANYMNYEASTTTTNQGSIVSPAISLTGGIDDAELSFWMHAYGASMGTLEVGVGTSATGPFTNEFTWTGQLQTAGSDPWVNVGVDLSTYLGQTIYIQFTQIDNNNSVGSGFDGDMSIDLMEVTTCQSCAVPSALAETNLTSSSVDLSWTNPNSSNAYVVEYGATGFTLGTGTQVTGSGTSATLSGLTAATDYDWYVQSVCTPGSDSSSFVGPNSFSTPCAPFVAPYTESFDNTSLPSCWSRTAASGGPWVFGNPGIGWNTSGCSVTPSDHTANGGNIASMDHSGTDAGVILQMGDVDVSGLTTPYLDFYHFMCATGYSPANETYVEAFDGTSWSQVALINIGTAAWENYGFDLSSFVFNTNIVRLRFRTESGGSGTDFYGDIALDDISIVEAPSCINPASPLSANLTSSSADLSWTNPNTSTAYVIEYGAPGFTLGTGTQITGSGTSTTLSGLMSNTTYDWYVQSVCTPGSDSSAFVGPASFTTPCNPFTAPYFSDFESDALDAPPSCWLEYKSYANGFVEVENFTGTASPFAGSQALYIYSSSGFTQGSDTLIAISPQFSDLSGNDKQIRFQGNSDDPTTTLIIGTVASPSPSATFNPVDTIVFTTADTYQEVIVPFTTANGYNGTDEYIVFAHDLNNIFDYIRIDNFNYEQIPTCPKPQALNASAATPSSVDLDWTNGGTETEWQIAYGSAGFSLGSGTRVTANSNPFTVTGLTANTNYDFYVRAVCSTTDSSTWDGPISFATLCNASTAPYTESFAANSLPSCWTESSVSSGDAWEYGGSVDFGAAQVRPDAFGNNGEYAHIDFSDDPDTTSIITPLIDVSSLTNPRLTFFYNTQTTSTSFSPFNRLIVDYWNGSNWVNITVIDTLTTAGWTKYEFSASAYTFNTNFVQFRFSAQEGGAAIGGTGTFTYDQDLMLDEVVVEETPACIAPTALASTNLTTTSADLSWTENNAATSWEISYGPVGFTAGNGTEAVITTNPYTLSGLMSSTSYDWYVRSICGNNDTSGWSLAGNFSTAFAPCPSITAATLPFVERWESNTGTVTGTIDNIFCGSNYNWTFNSTNTDGRARFGTDAVLAAAGTGAITLDAITTTTVIANDLILTIDMSSYTSITDLELLFDFAHHGEESHANDSVWVRGSDTDPWVGIYDLYANRGTAGAYNNVGPIDVDAALTAAGQSPSATFQLRFGQEDNFPATSPTASDGFSFDNITLRQTPSCFAPINLTTSVITTTSADFSWNDTMATSAPEYEYSYGAPGFTPGNGTELVVTSDSVTVSGLTAATSYDWYVRAICGNNDTSLWSTTANFTTLCVPFTAPFSESFDNTTQPNCWSQSAISGGPWTFTGPGFTWNTQGCTFVPSDHTANGGSFAALDFSVPDAGVVLEMPDVDVASLTTPYLEFYYVQCNNLTPNNELFIEAYNGVDWDSVTVIQRGTNGWERFGFQVGAFTYGTNLVKIRFRAEDGGGTQFYGDMGLDDISIDDAPGTELAATTILSPNSGCGLTATETVSLEITNNGSAAQTGFSVGYSLNGTAITPETYTASIAPGATATYNFTTTADFSAVGTYNLVAYTDLTGDIDNSNDTASTVITNSINVASFPYSESFESGAAGWLVEGNAAWELGAPIGTIIDTASDGTQAWVTDLDANYPDNATGWVNSPCFDFTNVPNPYIRMDIWWDIETSWDGAVLQASDNNGATWQKVGDFGDPNNWYNDNTINALNAIEPSQEGWSGAGTSGSGAWVTAEHELDNFGGAANVKLRIVFASDGVTNNEGMAFDNVHVFDSVPPLPYYAIGTINTEDATTGDADSVNVECVTSGTVIGYDRRGPNSNGYEFAIVDLSSGSQEGITVFDFNDVSNYTTPTAGDSIMVYGEVDQFRGLIQFRPDSIVVLKTNATLPTPLVSTDLDESTESKWLSFPDKYVLLSASQGGSFNIDMVSVINPTDTLRMRIDTDTDINDSLAISTNAWAAGDTICGMLGVGGQFDFNSPFLDSYQVFPNSWSEITICRNTVGIKEENSVQDLTIFPNPTNGQFTIQTSGLKHANARLMIRDISGKVILEDGIAQSNQAFSKTIQLDDRAKGLYFVTITDGEQQYNYKLIVQ